MKTRTQSRIARIAVVLEGDTPRSVTTIAPGTDLEQLACDLLSRRPQATRVELRNAWGESVLEWTRRADGSLEERHRAAPDVGAPSTLAAAWSFVVEGEHDEDERT